MECAGEMGISCFKEMSGVIDWHLTGSKLKLNFLHILLFYVVSILKMSYSPFWGWPSGTPASILMEPGLIYSIHGGHPIKASMEDPVNMACQQQRRVNWGLKIHHSDILPCDTQDCLIEVWNWLKWGNVHCWCLNFTWSLILHSFWYLQKMTELHFKCYS